MDVLTTIIRECSPLQAQLSRQTPAPDEARLINAHPSRIKLLAASKVGRSKKLPSQAQQPCSLRALRNRLDRTRSMRKNCIRGRAQSTGQENAEGSAAAKVSQSWRDRDFHRVTGKSKSRKQYSDSARLVSESVAVSFAQPAARLQRLLNYRCVLSRRLVSAATCCNLAASYKRLLQAGPQDPRLQCRIQVTFFDEKDGSETTVAVPLGENLLEAAHNNEIDLEGHFTLCLDQESLIKHKVLAICAPNYADSARGAVEDRQQDQ